VPIRFHLPAYAPERLAFAYSPLLEAVLSLHVVLEPKHHPLQHDWVRRMRGLPHALRRRIGEFAFAYRRTLPDLLAPSPNAELRSFDEEMALLAANDESTLALEFLRPIYDHAGRRDKRLLSSNGVRRQALANAAALGTSAEVASLIFDDPKRLAREFAALLTEYWDAAFREEWDRLEPRLAGAVGEAGRAIAAGGLHAFLRGLSPRLRVDPAREEFGLDVPHDHRVEVTEENRLVLVPSAFVWPHVQLNCDPPWPLNIVYPASFVIADARPRIPSTDLVRVLRALADDTRLRSLRLIAERPRSTQELAPLVGISEAGLSKHLRQLAQAGVVTTRRDGYYVLYSLVSERLEPLSDTLQHFLAGEG
jgi:DNA-binding transcriptional ArsR family regulator